MSGVGLVVIGRNEGERLERCLQSTLGRGTLVYVDSGSVDGSVDRARSLGADVIELDPSRPFTAARARNAGLERLLNIEPELRYVQLIDGDCALFDAWIDVAAAELDRRPDLAVVCGRLRERFPEVSCFNRLADLEWDVPAGDAEACGGIALMRLAAIAPLGGFREDLIAGEEPELCARLRSAGWKVARLAVDMADHDMNMHRFSQWWKRSVRGGHACADGWLLHGAGPMKANFRIIVSNLVWGIALPLLGIGLAWPTAGVSLAVVVAAYLLFFVRVARRGCRRGWPPGHALLYALSILIGKPAHAIGALQCFSLRAMGRRSRLIEYKTVDRVPTPARGVANPLASSHVN